MNGCRWCWTDAGLGVTVVRPGFVRTTEFEGLVTCACRRVVVSVAVLPCPAVHGQSRPTTRPSAWPVQRRAGVVMPCRC